MDNSYSQTCLEYYMYCTFLHGRCHVFKIALFNYAVDVYKDTQSLVRSVMDGYNVCIFAYGQTGSGKTHTMVVTCLSSIN